MSTMRMHRLTAIYLVVLYGVVGITGESLHYLVVNPTAIWSSPPSGEVVVYYHTHGPDYHGHFHRHVHTADHSHSAPAARTSRDPRTQCGIRARANNARVTRVPAPVARIDAQVGERW